MFDDDRWGDDPLWGDHSRDHGEAPENTNATASRTRGSAPRIRGSSFSIRSTCRMVWNGSTFNSRTATIRSVARNPAP